MALNTDHLARCIQTLESSLQHLQTAAAGSIEYEIFRNAVIKGFELTLETAGKLLRKAVKAYTSNPRSVDELTYKEILRAATKHQLLTTEAVERWFQYRDNRNNTANDYGEAFAENTLKIIPAFISDSQILLRVLQETVEN